MIILSVHVQTHDTGVVLIKDGRVLFAASNERFSRRKMDRRVPIRALKECLEYTKIKPGEIDKLVFIGRGGIRGLWDFLSDNSRAMRLTHGKFPFWFKNPLQTLEQLFLSAGLFGYFYRQLIPETRIKRELKGFRGQVVHLPHHFCHAASAYYTSGWEDCLVGVIEGAGYNQSTSFWEVKDGRFSLLSETKLPHSAGRFYELVTLLLGFNRLKHAGKITGLAAFGNPKKAYNEVSKLLWVEDNKLRLDYSKYYRWLAYYSAHGAIPLPLRKYSREDLAAAFQLRLEECIVTLLQGVIKKSTLKKIALAGGVVANVKLNQKIHELKGIDEIYIHQAMGDDGLAMGGACYVNYIDRKKNVKPYNNVYLGPDYPDTKIKQVLKNYQVKYKEVKNLEREVARFLSEGKIVARFDGRMEYGPRALGNRSILYQTTDKTVNDWLNKHLKRTEFMPFAPVTLEEYADKCYKNLDGARFAAKFMTVTFECTEYMKKVSPAVVHVDGTARPQIINKKDNLSYYKILEEYHKITGIPSLINTSFNMHEEPIVCTPGDALRSFLAGNLDYMAIGNFLISKDQ